MTTIGSFKSKVPQESAFYDGLVPRPSGLGVRHKVLGMTILLGAVTYLDRVAMSVLQRPISEEFGLTDVQMGVVFSAFYVAYGAFEIPTGWWADKVGSRKVLTRIVVWWSTFTVLTGAALSYPALLVTRFLFGAGEAGAFPNVARTVSRWFPQRERGRAQGVFWVGAHLAGGVTPFLVNGLLKAGLHWRTIFVMFGSIGFVWRTPGGGGSATHRRNIRQSPPPSAGISPPDGPRSKNAIRRCRIGSACWPTAQPSACA